jgi:exopolysaccharide production repressor protein
MSVQKFIFGMLLVVAVVTAWSLIDGASWGTIALRMIASAILLQVGYFLVVLVLVGRERGRSQSEQIATSSAKRSDNGSVTSEQKVSH